MIKVWGSPFFHRLRPGMLASDDLWYTICGIRFAYTSRWPKGDPIAERTPCPECHD